MIESSPDVTEPSSDLSKVKSGSNFLGEGTSLLDESDELNESTFKRLVLDSGGTARTSWDVNKDDILCSQECRAEQ